MIDFDDTVVFGVCPVLMTKVFWMFLKISANMEYGFTRSGY
jgi:hypothetical protein